MYKGKKIIAVIPARGGSKGIPDKNIKPLAGKPLIAWTIEAAKASSYIDRLILSSDSKKIIDTGIDFGCEAPFIRPAELANDDTPGVEAFIHAVENVKGTYDYAVLLQCTSPLRTTVDIDEAIRLCIDKGASSCTSVSEASTTPYKMVKIDAMGRLKSFLGLDTLFQNRQDLQKVYDTNGAIYIISTKVLLETKRLVSDDTLAYIMDRDRSVDIDSSIDFAVAQAQIELISKRGDRK